MIDIEELDKTICELENSSTNFSNCQKLSVLYIVREHFNSVKLNDNVLKEYNDFLPAYNQYKQVKRQYQLGEITKDKVLEELNYVCNEISEFIHSLYINSDMPEERKILYNMITKMKGQT